MNHFEDSPTHELVTELLARIEHSNGLDFVGWDDLITLRNLLISHLDTMTNPYIYAPNPDKPATFVPPRSLSIWESLYDVKLPTLDNPSAE